MALPRVRGLRETKLVLDVGELYMRLCSLIIGRYFVYLCFVIIASSSTNQSKRALWERLLSRRWSIVGIFAIASLVPSQSELQFQSVWVYCNDLASGRRKHARPWKTWLWTSQRVWPTNITSSTNTAGVMLGHIQSLLSHCRFCFLTVSCHSSIPAVATWLIYLFLVCVRQRVSVATRSTRTYSFSLISL